MEINNLFDTSGVILPLAISVNNIYELDKVCNGLQNYGLKPMSMRSTFRFPCFIATHANGCEGSYTDLENPNGNTDRKRISFIEFLELHYKPKDLISGTDAFIHVINGKDVVWSRKSEPDVWRKYKKSTTFSINDLSNGEILFKLKPSTIMIGDIEVPAPFDPEEGEWYFYIVGENYCGYSRRQRIESCLPLQFGCWKTEDEIKQVVEALRKLLKI